MTNPVFGTPQPFSLTRANNPTSTKQNLTYLTGLLAAASTGSTGGDRIVFRRIPVETGLPGDVAPGPNGNLAYTISD